MTLIILSNDSIVDRIIENTTRGDLCEILAMARLESRIVSFDNRFKQYRAFFVLLLSS